MRFLLLLLLLLLGLVSIFSNPAASGESGYISVVISEDGLVFAKDLLVEQAVRSVTPLRLPDVEKSIRIPFVGVVSAAATKITLWHIDVPSSTVQPGGTGVVIAASGAAASLSMEWRYSYRAWLLPIEISDSGSALVEVEGMEVGLTMHMKNRKGVLELNITECGCYVKDISISLDGGASWFYQGFLNAFEAHIRSAVEKSITQKIGEGILKLDSLLQSIPKEVDVDNVAALNVTFVNDPLFGNSSVEVDISGLFVPLDKVALPSYLHNNLEPSVSCEGPLKMLDISLDEAVFNSASRTYFQAGVMQWIVDKVPDQSLLNTASWKYLIPQLYKQYPNAAMQLILSLTSPPVITVKPWNIDTTIFSEMTVNVLDASETVSVACIAVVISASGVVEISGNNLAGKVELNDFTLELKWSTVGYFHMYLIQGVMRIFLTTVFIPLMNSRLHKGFPLPIINGFTLQNAGISISSSKLVVCSDVVFTGSSGQLLL